MWVIVSGLIVNLIATIILVIAAATYAPSEAFQVDD